MPALVEAIDALLPQTQCMQCGYPGCRPYAERLAAGHADINQCPPGGDDTIRELAVLLQRTFKSLDPKFGVIKPPAVAAIDEQACIGCTLCIQVCPVDAIVGAAKVMHTILERDCTGCELCIPVCPVDCISMHESGRRLTRQERQAAAAAARHHFQRRNLRLQRNKVKYVAKPVSPTKGSTVDKKRTTIEKAVERARIRLGQSGR